MFVPFAPGGTVDIVARFVGARLGEELGQPFVVENRAGAGGVVGAELVANAPKDGHTLLVVSLAITVNPWLYALPYDHGKAWAPVAVVATAPNVISVHPDLPAQSVSDLIALAKKQPGKLQYGSSGVGTFLHLGPELFKLMAGVDILHVPYRGAAPAMIDVMGGRTQMAFGSIPSTITHLRSGKLRALGVGAATRSGSLPDVPTVSESGLPGYEAANWIGIVAPAGTPAAIVARLNADTVKVLGRDDVRATLGAQGLELRPGSPEQFAAHIKSEIEKFSRIARTAGIKAE
jgi:tripartite-type tricarboxylate transporter receptor subunit TctC